MAKEGPKDEWEEKKKGDESTVRENIFEEDQSSQYIRGAISEASQSEMEAADSIDGGRLGRFATRISRGLAESSLPKIMYKMNPFNYDKIDWVFAFGFFMVIANAVMMFVTSSPRLVIASVVGMFLSFCVMLLCIGIEDYVKEGVHRLRLGMGLEREGFEGGETFDEDDGGNEKQAP